MEADIGWGFMKKSEYGGEEFHPFYLLDFIQGEFAILKDGEGHHLYKVVRVNRLDMQVTVRQIHRRDPVLGSVIGNEEIRSPVEFAWAEDKSATRRLLARKRSARAHANKRRQRAVSETGSNERIGPLTLVSTSKTQPQAGV